MSNGGECKEDYSLVRMRPLGGPGAPILSAYFVIESVGHSVKTRSLAALRDDHGGQMMAASEIVCGAVLMFQAGVERRSDRRK